MFNQLMNLPGYMNQGSNDLCFLYALRMVYVHMDEGCIDPFIYYAFLLFITDSFTHCFVHGASPPAAAKL